MVYSSNRGRRFPSDSSDRGTPPEFRMSPPEMKDMNKRILPLVLFLLCAPLLAGNCRRPDRLPDPANYRQFIVASADILCRRMIECSEKLTRSLSPALQARISVQKCRRAALHNLDEKLKRHNPLMVQLSVKCYEALLKSPCKRIAKQALFEPACMLLRRETDRVLSAPSS